MDAGTDVINSVIGLKDAVTNLYKAFEGTKDFKPLFFAGNWCSGLEGLEAAKGLGDRRRR